MSTLRDDDRAARRYGQHTDSVCVCRRDVDMTKSKLNLIIDAVMFLCMAAIAGIGLLIKYVLVPGQARWAIYGRNVELYFQGLDRHQWGIVHLAIGLVLIALLVLHIVLHWGMILVIYRSLIPSRVFRWVVLVILICLTAILLAFSCFVKPEVGEIRRGGGQRGRGYQTPVGPTGANQRFANQSETTNIC